MEEAGIKPIYKPSKDKPLNLVVFGSGSGTNLEAFLRASRELVNEEGKPLFRVRAIFTDRLCRLHEIAEIERIPLIYHSFLTFFKDSKVLDRHDFKMRVDYDQVNVRLIDNLALEHQFSVDLIFLAGYMRLTFPPLLNRFKNKILNVHPADLTVIDKTGSRLHIGDNAVFDALVSGEKRTRSSVILVDEKVDHGPILVSGPWVDYEEGYPVTFKRAAFHQEKQKLNSDWPASIKAVELIATGRLALDNNNVVYIDKKAQGLGGYVLGSMIVA